MKELLRQIETDWKINRTAEEYKILVNYTSRARTLCIIYSSIVRVGHSERMYVYCYTCLFSYDV